MTSQFLDRDAAQRARSNLHSVYWEMLLAAGLLEAGATLVPRSKRTPRNSGPDLLSESPKTWVEAVAADAGTGPDAVPPPPELTAYSVPDDEILLRITQAIERKRLKRDDYVRRKWLKETIHMLSV